jgi:hypothetical protein
MAARKIHASLSYQMRQAQEKMQRVTLQMHDWRQVHPLRARTHDLGLIPSTYLIEREQAREEAWLRAEDLKPGVNDARSRAEDIAADIGQRIEVEQKPVREQVANLEQKYAEKMKEERAERYLEANLNRIISLLKVHAFKRERGMQGYKDNGGQWKALPESAREAIDRFNTFQRTNGRGSWRGYGSISGSRGRK